MTTTNQAVFANVARLGFPLRRVRAVATYMTAAGVLPPGGPGKSPDLDPEHVVSLILGCALDVPLRAVAESVRQYRDLGRPGHDASEMPASLAAKYHDAGDNLDVLADMAVHGASDAQADVSKMKIEIVANWPEIAIHHVDGSVQRFRDAGALAGHWSAGGHRRSVLINGSAFVDTFRDLFGDK